ncbi:winged helix-turn-helix domain-containing protein [Methanolobus zinderi]|uniref:Winged helix-turn-helix domain-containing protein n=1 Tax=Methanolobus zinderi TaxID=536044 RepID=A0A7D5E5D0_9EURY|nr:winged helix-turn-helix domain-containing protein [Methanolobus zinderi]QLC49012.1 winged helix-turn-helix domain-containing protein [Methanolobus zinderi]
MKKQITDVLLASEKRKNVLLLLQEGSQEMETLLEELDTSRTALLPQLKILRENHLIAKSDDSYELTTTGKLITDEMEKFLRTANIFGGDHAYLGTHYIDFIPEDLLKKIPGLGSYQVEDISINEFFDTDEEFFEKAVNSHYWFEITSTLHPTFHDFYVEMTDYITEVEIVINREVYEKLKKDYYEEFKELIDLKLVSFYLYPEELGFISFTLSSESIKFKLLTKEGKPDNQKLIFSGPNVFGWGKELFEHYKKNSTPIIEIG